MICIHKNIIKIVIGGAGGVGKTSLLKRYVEGTFSLDVKMTIGAQFYIKEIHNENVEYLMQIWDFAGEERFRFMFPQYCRGASGAILCYDLTNYETFHQLPDWIQMLRTASKNVPIVLVGTKCDLPGTEISEEMGSKFCQETKSLANFICSAKINQNITEIFEKLIQKISLDKAAKPMMSIH